MLAFDVSGRQRWQWDGKVYTLGCVRERETVSVIFTCPAHISKQSVFVANLGEEMKYIDSMKLSRSSF